MNQIQLFKFFILFLLYSLSFSLDLKPDNDNEIVKIKVDDKNRTYYHLSKNNELIFSLNNTSIKKY